MSYCIGYLYIYNCHIFLDLSLDHYVVSFIVSCNNLYLKSIISDNMCDTNKLIYKTKIDPDS